MGLLRLRKRSSSVLTLVADLPLFYSVLFYTPVRPWSVMPAGISESQLLARVRTAALPSHPTLLDTVEHVLQTSLPSAPAQFSSRLTPIESYLDEPSGKS